MSYENQSSTRAFYYLDKVEHLALGQAHNVVANGVHQLPINTVVLNYARSADKQRWYAQVGIATGNVSDKVATEVWPEWSNPSASVFDVVWVTKIVEVPAELFTNQRHSLPIVDREPIVQYVLTHQTR
jgi:hypothetical protein